MSELIRGYRHPGDIEVRGGMLITTAGQVIDIRYLIGEINIYQDIESHHMSCNIVLNDSINLFELIPSDEENKVSGGFSGFEVFLFSFKNKTDSSEADSVDSFNTYAFRMNSLEDRIKLNEGKEAYSLTGISPEYFSTHFSKISRALGKGSGKTINKMVESLVKEFSETKDIKGMYDELGKVTKLRVKKENTYDLTSGAHRFIIPNLTIDSTIDFLCNEADSPDHTPLYKFYETSTGYNFKNLSTLMTQEPKARFMYKQTNIKDSKPKDGEDAPLNDDPFKIISYDVVKQTDSIDSISNGLFRQSTLNVDVLKKTSYTVDYSYEKYWDKFKTLQGNRISGNIGNAPILNMFTTRTGHQFSGDIASENHLPKRVNETFAQSTAYESVVFNTVIDVMVPGMHDLNVGDVLDIEIPMATGMMTDKDGKGLDKYLSGKYLITKMRHKISGGKTGSPYACVMELSKDTGII